MTSDKLYVSLLADGTVPVGVETRMRRPLIWGSADLELEPGTIDEVVTGGEAWLRCFEVDAPLDEEGTIILQPWATISWADGDGFNIYLYPGPLNALDALYEFAGEEPVTRGGSYPNIPGIIGEGWSCAVGHTEDDEGYFHIVQLVVQP